MATPNYTAFVNEVHASNPERFVVAGVQLDVRKVLGYLALNHQGYRVFTNAASRVDDDGTAELPDFSGAPEYQLALELSAEFSANQTAGIELEELEYRVLPVFYTNTHKQTVIEGITIVWTKVPSNETAVISNLRKLVRETGLQIEFDHNYSYVTLTFTVRGMYTAADLPGLVDSILGGVDYTLVA